MRQRRSHYAIGIITMLVVVNKAHANTPYAHTCQNAVVLRCSSRRYHEEIRLFRYAYQHWPGQHVGWLLFITVTVAYRHAASNGQQGGRHHHVTPLSHLRASALYARCEGKNITPKTNVNLVVTLWENNMVTHSIWLLQLVSHYGCRLKYCPWLILLIIMAGHHAIIGFRHHLSRLGQEAIRHAGINTIIYAAYALAEPRWANTIIGSLVVLPRRFILLRHRHAAINSSSLPQLAMSSLPRH